MKHLSKLHTETIEKAKTEQAKVKAAALAMIEMPMDLIKAVLLKHEEAVIEVMRELQQQQQQDEALLRQALDTLQYFDDYIQPLTDKFGGPKVAEPYSTSWHVHEAIAAIKERLK